MADFDIRVDFTLNAVIRGARDEAHAHTIARVLAYRVASANECLRGRDYGQPLVTEFSLNDDPRTSRVDPLSEEV